MTASKPQGGRRGGQKQDRKAGSGRPATRAQGGPPKKTARLTRKPGVKPGVKTGVKTGVKSAGNSKDGHRLQKVLAAAGHGSRRQCEELIVAGRVEVDRVVVDQLGTRVDTRHHEVRVDGVPLQKMKRLYYVVNKPTGVLCTNSDPDGRMRVIDLIGDDHRMFSVGRLDMSSEGLVLVTNDGELANRLTHPRYEVAKEYHVMVAGQVGVDSMRQLEKGIFLAEGLSKAESVRIKKRHKNTTMLVMVLREGRNREIRRVLARLGHKVLTLTRVAMGPLRLGELPTGAYRTLSGSELTQLRRAARLDGDGGGRRAPAKKTKTTRPSGSRAVRPATPRSSKPAEPRPARTTKSGESRGAASARAQAASRQQVSQTVGTVISDDADTSAARASKSGGQSRPARSKSRSTASSASRSKKRTTRSRSDVKTKRKKR